MFSQLQCVADCSNWRSFSLMYLVLIVGLLTAFCWWRGSVFAWRTFHDLCLIYG